MKDGLKKSELFKLFHFDSLSPFIWNWNNHGLFHDRTLSTFER